MLRHIVSVVLLMFVSGCGHGVAWRADSSGFVYTDKGGTRVVSFDLKTKTSRPVVIDPDAKTLLPALSPDGKRVALARLEYPRGARPRLQVRLYTSEGKEERRSVWFARDDEPGQGDRVEPAYLYWTAQDRIVVAAAGVCLYDVRQDTFIEVGKVTPWLFGGSPLRPDGKGCLVYREKAGGKAELLFLDWDGGLRPVGELAGKGDKGMTLLAEWDGDVALVMRDGKLHEADTAKGTWRESRRKLPVLKSEGMLLAYHVFPGGRKAVCIYEREEAKGKQKRVYQAVEAQDLTTSSRRLLLEGAQHALMLYPSPDRATVVLPYMLNGNQDVRLLVVGSDGKAVSDIKISQ